MDIPQMIIGSFQTPSYNVLKGIVKCGFDCDLAAFDTAPSYGTEQNLGKALKEISNGRTFFCSNKIDAIQMYHGNIIEHVLGRLKQMNLDYFDVLLIHWPLPQYMDRTWKQMLELKEAGIVHSIGICNVRVRHLKEYREKCIIPDYIQIERHPLNICNDELEYCHDHNIKVMAYSPLGRMLPSIKNSNILKDLSVKYHKNIGQIILRWHIDSGVIPVFGTRKIKRLKTNIDIYDFSLQKDEIEAINSMNQNIKIFLESWGCPKF